MSLWGRWPTNWWSQMLKNRSSLTNTIKFYKTPSTIRVRRATKENLWKKNHLSSRKNHPPGHSLSARRERRKKKGRDKVNLARQRKLNLLDRPWLNHSRRGESLLRRSDRLLAPANPHTVIVDNIHLWHSAQYTFLFIIYKCYLAPAYIFCLPSELAD